MKKKLAIIVVVFMLIFVQNAVAQEKSILAQIIIDGMAKLQETYVNIVNERMNTLDEKYTKEIDGYTQKKANEVKGQLNEYINQEIKTSDADLKSHLDARKQEINTQISDEMIGIKLRLKTEIEKGKQKQISDIDKALENGFKEKLK